MPTPRRKSDTAAQLATLSQRAPYVMTQRLLRMGNPAPNAADRRDLDRMGAEKLSALQEGRMAMAMQVFELQQRAWVTLLQSAWTPWRPGMAMQAWSRGMADVDAVWAAGLRPATRQVSANARRLARTRRR
ncbi:MAG: hypothetical protein M3414_09865 [Pseudomonadota bacterium]|nr:hypothetical protein [Pseudomonadota bacterium]